MRGLILLVTCAGAALGAGAPDRGAFARADALARLFQLERAIYEKAKAGPLADPIGVITPLLEGFSEVYPARDYPEGNTNIARALLNLGLYHDSLKQHAEAERFFRRALAMRESLRRADPSPAEEAELVITLAKMARHLDTRGKLDEAEALYLRHLRICEAWYAKKQTPTGAGNIGGTLHYLGNIYARRGEHWRAEPLFRRSLALMRLKRPKSDHPKGHLDIVRAMQDLAEAQEARGDYANALAGHTNALYMCIDLARGPDLWLVVSAYKTGVAHRLMGDLGRAEVFVSMALKGYERLVREQPSVEARMGVLATLNTLSVIHESQGEFTKAEEVARRSLRLTEPLVGAADGFGKARLRVALNNLALACNSAGKTEEAGKHYRAALRAAEEHFTEARYPGGHSELLASLLNLASWHRRGEGRDEEKELMLRALAMARRLYPADRFPRGHPLLALTVNNTAAMYGSRGELAQALRLHAHTLEMASTLFPARRYPDGHPELARAYFSLGLAHLKGGAAVQAEALLGRALHAYGTSAVNNAAHLGEATALNHLASMPRVRDYYLDAAARAGVADAYAAVWQSKAALSRVLERRHLTLLASAEKGVKKEWDQLTACRREREGLLLAPADGPGGEARRRRIAELDEEVRRLEPMLLVGLPGLEARGGDGPSPADLRKALPADAAFVDLLRYQGRAEKAKYVAFVVTRDAASRVELGEAAVAEELLALWRRAISEASPAEPKYAAELHRILWVPLVKHLPAGASVVHVAPDGGLHRLPWAALRDGKTGRILIEDHAVAVVPHGPSLLARLTERGRKPAGGPILAVGGVAYGGAVSRGELASLRSPAGETLTWADLPGTETELARLKALAGGREVASLSKTAATLPRLLAALPKAGHAHLATHGFFAAPGLRTAFQLDEALFTRGRTGERATPGARSPLLLSGLVCAGANHKGTANRGILTAEAVIGLDLRKLDLAVLSACETGLGEVAGGEGVFGLVRAFHVAGTRDVIASQWKVPDRATAALMDRFYRRLWGKSPVTPLEALRHAQLDVYRNPELIPEWAASRGPLPDPFKGGAPAAVKPLPTGKGAPARDWAAFLLSGTGR